MSQSKTARTYARALIELCEDSKSRTATGEELAAVAGLFGELKELRALLVNPTVSVDAKREIISEIAAKAQLSKRITRFLDVLLEAGRLPELEDIASAYDEQLDEIENRARAELSSAVPLAAGEVDRIKKALEKLTGKTVVVTTRVDPDLIGGVVTRMGSVVMDGSLRARLESMRERLLN